jgi:hypothetical protein
LLIFSVLFSLFRSPVAAAAIEARHRAEHESDALNASLSALQGLVHSSHISTSAIASPLWSEPTPDHAVVHHSGDDSLSLSAFATRTHASSLQPSPPPPSFESPSSTLSLASVVRNQTVSPVRPPAPTFMNAHVRSPPAPMPTNTFAAAANASAVKITVVPPPLHQSLSSSAASSESASSLWAPSAASSTLPSSASAEASSPLSNHAAVAAATAGPLSQLSSLGRGIEALRSLARGDGDGDREDATDADEKSGAKNLPAFAAASPLDMTIGAPAETSARIRRMQRSAASGATSPRLSSALTGTGSRSSSSASSSADAAPASGTATGAGFAAHSSASPARRNDTLFSAAMHAAADDDDDDATSISSVKHETARSISRLKRELNRRVEQSPAVPPTSARNMGAYVTRLRADAEASALLLQPSGSVSSSSSTDLSSLSSAGSLSSSTNTSSAMSAPTAASDFAHTNVAHFTSPSLLGVTPSSSAFGAPESTFQSQSRSHLHAPSPQPSLPIVATTAAAVEATQPELAAMRAQLGAREMEIAVMQVRCPIPAHTHIDPIFLLFACRSQFLVICR